MDDLRTDLTIPDELPVLPLRELVVFPYMVVPLFIARERSIAAIEDALAGDRLLMVTAQRDSDIETPEPDDLYRVGTVVMVMRILRMADGRVKVLVQGLAKAEIDSFVEREQSNWVRVTPKPEDEEREWCVEAEALVREVRSRVEELLPLKNLPPEVLVDHRQRARRRTPCGSGGPRILKPRAERSARDSRDPSIRWCVLRRVDALLRRELDVTTVQGGDPEPRFKMR